MSLVFRLKLVLNFDLLIHRLYSCATASKKVAEVQIALNEQRGTVMIFLATTICRLSTL